MTDSEAREYFADFAAAFGAFDAEQIATFMNVPLTIVQPTASHVPTASADIVSNFEAMNAEHKRLGVAHIDAESVAVLPTYHDNCVEARVSWRFSTAARELIYRFRMVYLLGRFASPDVDGPPWKVVVAVNLDAAHRE